MPILIDIESRTGLLVRAVNDILIESGPAGLTMRNIAHASRVSASSIYGQMGSREHLLRVAAGQTARARLESIRAESTLDGVLAFIPRTSEEVLDARAWLGWLELWRSEAFLERWISEPRDEERGLLARLTEYDWRRSELDELLALIEGLQVAVCAPVRPMRLEVARAILETRCHTLAGSRVLPLPDRSRRTA
jgi:AcrR family transcriptional regulator